MRWGNSENGVRLYFGGSKITADGDCSHEIMQRAGQDLASEQQHVLNKNEMSMLLANS